MEQNNKNTAFKNLINQPYKYGFTTDIETEQISPGLSRDVISLISSKKNEPNFMLDFRQKAFTKWNEMKEHNKTKENQKKNEAKWNEIEQKKMRQPHNNDNDN